MGINRILYNIKTTELVAGHSHQDYHKKISNIIHMSTDRARKFLSGGQVLYETLIVTK
jgi:hypothetical protein